MKARHILGGGLVALLVAGGIVGKHLYDYHLPTYYVLKDVAEEQRTEIDGEKNFKTVFSQKTVDEIRKEFSEFYGKRHAAAPDTSIVTDDDLIEFGVQYVDEKLSFRYPVIWPSKIVTAVRMIPFIGGDLAPRKENEYFEKMYYVDIAGQNERLTDCWDYSQLFKMTFNILAKDFETGSTCHRVCADGHFAYAGMDKKLEEHDFNLIIDKEGNKRYIDSNGADTFWVTNPVDITFKIRE
ncbi:MAG: hypothetical protein V1725_00760 [archaeon]